MPKTIPISSEDLAQGWILCVANARRLTNDGDILKNQNCVLSAISLYRIAFEEWAKALMLANASLFQDDEPDSWRWLYRNFTSHRGKLFILFSELTAKSAPELDKYVQHRTRQREMSLYVDFGTGVEKFCNPEVLLLTAAGDLLTLAKRDRQVLKRIDYLSTRLTISSFSAVTKQFKQYRELGKGGQRYREQIYREMQARI